MRGVRIYKCHFDGCIKSFSRKGDLNRHTLIHTQDRPHICSTCGRGFSQASGLKTHQNVHTGDKPHLCTYSCGKAFGDPSSCSRHVKEIHETMNPYRCPGSRCRTSIKRRGMFIQHLRKKHQLSREESEAHADLLEGAAHPVHRGRDRRGRRAESISPSSPPSSATSEEAAPLIHLPDVSMLEYAPQSTIPSYGPPQTYLNYLTVPTYGISRHNSPNPGMVYGLTSSRSSSQTPSLSFSSCPSPAPSTDGYQTPPMPSVGHNPGGELSYPVTVPTDEADYVAYQVLNVQDASLLFGMWDVVPKQSPQPQDPQDWMNFYS
ncbi:hypothetical protein DFS33DRAFT_611554 [Desarmillaria ectypa]|nr:hypothetical protein DFS33DRAFT_611554 [Desarmillaria ectypa]